MIGVHISLLYPARRLWSVECETRRYRESERAYVTKPYLLDFRVGAAVKHEPGERR